MLFILGHMRTGSSLLTHILTSNQDVFGYGETHRVYKSPEDFGATSMFVQRRLRKIAPAWHAYLLDKILHKDQIAQVDVLKHPSVRVVFMIRRPDMALSSIVQNVDSSQEPQEAHQHYSKQVQWIEKLADSLSSDRWTYTTYTEVTQNTDAVFSRLESFLDLSESLTEHYDTNQYTGVSGVGDPGPHIEAGRIKRDIDHDVDPRMRPYLDQAWERFESCRHVLKRDGEAGTASFTD